MVAHYDRQKETVLHVHENSYFRMLSLNTDYTLYSDLRVSFRGVSEHQTFYFYTVPLHL